MEDLIGRVSIKSAVTVALGTNQSQDASPARPEPLAGPRLPPSTQNRAEFIHLVP